MHISILLWLALFGARSIVNVWTVILPIHMLNAISVVISLAKHALEQQTTTVHRVTADTHLIRLHSLAISIAHKH